MRNIALKLMYNGTAYHGWQVQKNAVTVCETLQKALEKITGAPVLLPSTPTRRRTLPSARRWRWRRISTPSVPV